MKTSLQRWGKLCRELVAAPVSRADPFEPKRTNEILGLTTADTEKAQIPQRNATDLLHPSPNHSGQGDVENAEKRRAMKCNSCEERTEVTRISARNLVRNLNLNDRL